MRDWYIKSCLDSINSEHLRSQYLNFQKLLMAGFKSFSDKRGNGTSGLSRVMNFLRSEVCMRTVLTYWVNICLTSGIGQK